ncbi:MAG: bifunctional glutamate N-acetyltransferase/amino-acid acetyltransferase ArgJ [Coriobacteriia bacterium]|nr:bifunctional glutamate N-acetyltransferase/amino-acid acetyltransferase ArgJ [Coriobacteriia bacterium]
MSGEAPILDAFARAVPGFSAAVTAAGFKKSSKDDLALIYAPAGACVAATFTQSNVVAAPVVVSREHAARGEAVACIINAGNANACTGSHGMTVARKTCAALADALDVTPEEVLVASTGVIGVPFDAAQITDKIPQLLEQLDSGEAALEAVARAIMTTDTVPKTASAVVEVGGTDGTDGAEKTTYTVTGIAKGSGMIAPNMATMIGCVLTDAPLTQEACAEIWHEAVAQSFNCVTVDGDTSTNDTAVLMSSGVNLGHAPIDSVTDAAAYAALKKAITAVCTTLAHAIVRDGEGATKFVTVTVTGAPSDTDARTVARTIADSPLVKTALFGNDANWGRVAAAAGRAGVAFDPCKLSISFAGIEVCSHGSAVVFDEKAAAAALARPEIELTVDIGAGEGSAQIWTCDLSYDYIKINGEYRN